MTGSLRLTIGTAGHVDHGKTSLVRALTGVDTDRWAEEKRRGMTIDLGFARWTLPGGRHAAVVDVPGHERFLRNMLAGATGIDLVMLVVAADDGMMPQTREHLDILQLLQIRCGLVVITKTDLVDQELLGLAMADVREGLAGTFLADAPIVPVSSITGEGLPRLADVVEALVATTQPRQTANPPRMAVDRVFTRPGFGTVVTGTMLSGLWSEGDRVAVWPGDRPARIRGIQVHGEAVTTAMAGERVALNLSGLERQDLQRGTVVGAPGTIRTSRRLAARITLLSGPGISLRHRDRVRLHLGTADAIGRILLLDADLWAPGQGGDAVLELETPLAVDFGDRFILRRYSPLTTLGGGVVLHPAVDRLRRRHAPTLARLEAYACSDWSAVLEALLATSRRPQARAWVLQEVPAAGAAALSHLHADGRIQDLPGIGLVHRDRSVAWQEALNAAIRSFLLVDPWRLGMPRESAIRSLQLGAATIDWLADRLSRKGTLQVHGGLFIPSDHQPRWPQATGTHWQRLETTLETVGLTDIGDLTVAFPMLADRLPSFLFDRAAVGSLVPLGHEIVATRAAWDRLVATLRQQFTSPFTTSQAREALGISRRFAIPLLETCDRLHITRRQGDRRTLNNT